MRTWLGILFILLPILLISYINLPAGQSTHTIDLPLIEFPSKEIRGEANPPVSKLNEPRQLTLTVPEFIRLGDTRSTSLLVFIPEAVDGNVSFPTDVSSTLADIYLENNLVAEARMDLPGIKVMPFGDVSSPMAAGKNLTFRWKLSPRQEGLYEGNLWFYIQVVPKDGSKPQRQALFAFPVAIDCRSFLGMSTPILYWLSGGMFLFGSVLLILQRSKKQTNM